MAVINSDKQAINKISEEIVSMTAIKAVLNVQGVNRLSDSLAENITKMISGKENPTSGVKISFNKEGIHIDIFIIVNFGVKIPQLAWDIQNNVKEAVEEVTDFKVKEVNIHIQGVADK